MRTCYLQTPSRMPRFEGTGKILGALVLLAGLSLATGNTALANTITVTGATCTGCTTTDSTLTYGETNPLSPFSFNITAASGDVYTATGTVGASFDDSGTSFTANLNVAYAGSTPTTTADTFTVDILQNFYDTDCCTWAGDYSESTGSTVTGTGASFTVNLLWDGQGIGVLGPFTSTSSGASLTSALGEAGSGYETAFTNALLQGDFQFTYTFAAGSTPGSGAGSGPETPEPATMLPMAALALAAAGWKLRSRFARA